MTAQQQLAHWLLQNQVNQLHGQVVGLEIAVAALCLSTAFALILVLRLLTRRSP